MKSGKQKEQGQGKTTQDTAALTFTVARFQGHGIDARTTLTRFLMQRLLHAALSAAQPIAPLGCITVDMHHRRLRSCCPGPAHSQPGRYSGCFCEHPTKSGYQQLLHLTRRNDVGCMSAKALISSRAVRAWYSRKNNNYTVSDAGCLLQKCRMLSQ